MEGLFQDGKLTPERYLQLSAALVPFGHANRKRSRRRSMRPWMWKRSAGASSSASLSLSMLRAAAGLIRGPSVLSSSGVQAGFTWGSRGVQGQFKGFRLILPSVFTGVHVAELATIIILKGGKEVENTHEHTQERSSF